MFGMRKYEPLKNDNDQSRLKNDEAKFQKMWEEFNANRQAKLIEKKNAINQKQIQTKKIKYNIPSDPASDILNDACVPLLRR